MLQDAGCALLTAHTNADQAVGGVSEALATALGLTGLAPITVGGTEHLDKLTTYSPWPTPTGCGRRWPERAPVSISDYDSASFSTPGEGRFRPLPGANPTIGEVGTLEVVDEVRIECVLARAARPMVVAAMLAAHPYEEPAYDVVELADPGTAQTGSGRVGTIEETSLEGFVRQVASALPPTAHGVRVAGDPTRVVPPGGRVRGSGRLPARRGAALPRRRPLP